MDSRASLYSNSQNRLRIGIYCESPGEEPGGAEFCVAVAAEELSWNHEVQIVHHKSSEGIKHLSDYTGCDLSRVQFRHVEPVHDASVRIWLPGRRRTKALYWRRELTENFDHFVAFVHNKPPFCYAKNGVLVVLFPTFKPRMKFSFWQSRMETWTHKVAISEFSRFWARKRWRIDCEILNPPVGLNFRSADKMPRILSVGRFATTGHSKRQHEMITAFQSISPSLPDWTYACVGGLSPNPADQDFFQKVRTLAASGAISVDANLPRKKLNTLFETSSIFWHAAGFGDDENQRPENAEHFGITTVEAMAAGCVPVVIAKGGQPEIVEHGVSGFVWSTLDELRGFTRRLVEDSALRQKMSQAARHRAKTFGKAVFLHKLHTLLGLG